MSKISVALLIALGLGATACNTVEGAGQDVSAAGRGIENASEETREEINEEF